MVLLADRSLLEVLHSEMIRDIGSGGSIGAWPHLRRVSPNHGAPRADST
jgi:hypothetical protein